ncbi:MAG: sulfotransferase [Halioglobus sp.]
MTTENRSHYLFVLCPPYSGSTLLWKLLATSANVSALPSEGQFLPELEQVMRDRPWRDELNLPWPHIKSIWLSYWDTSKPVLLEKSPPHLIRAQQIAEHFQPVSFIVMARNPYALCEGLIRRNQWTAEAAAKHALRCLIAQQHNLQRFPESLKITYESLTNNPAVESQRIIEFLPILESLDIQASFEIHSIDGTLSRPIVDLNPKKIAELSDEQIRDINDVLSEGKEALNYWGYELLPGSQAPM